MLWLFGKLRNKDVVEGLSEVIPKNKTLLDIGCGNGKLSKALAEVSNAKKIVGLEVKKWSNPVIEVKFFDGKKIPFKENSFDHVLFVDVLHHIREPKKILNEALRVSKESVIIKDHYFESKHEMIFLKAVDFMCNLFYNIPMEFTFLSLDEWKKLENVKIHSTWEWFGIKNIVLELEKL